MRTAATSTGPRRGKPGESSFRRRPGGGGGRRKVCRFCVDKQVHVDYKDVRTLTSFISDRGKIIPSRITGNCSKCQRRLTRAIKQARVVALLPYS